MTTYELLQKTVRQLPRPAARWTRLFGVAVMVGLLAGLGAVLLEKGLHYGSELIIERFTDFSAVHVLSFKWQLLAIPAAGGLLSGILIRLLCPTAVGHGTDLLVRAFHREGGALPMRGPLVKAAAAIGVISCGGSAGPEGPVAALGAAIGSSMARLLGMTPRERRIMLIAGCGAGIGAIFECPMGGAIFAAGILYRDPDYETDAIVPAFVASVIGYCTFFAIEGRKFALLESAKSFSFESPWELIVYAILGVVCAVFCVVFYKSLSFVEDRPLAKAGMPRWLAPAVGGVATGAVACIIPQVMDGQYEFILDAMGGALDQQFAALSPWRVAAFFGAVAIAKCIATGLTVGSGGSGGVLGPSVFIGGAAGAFVGALLDAVLPGAVPDDLRKALIPVGMAGVLSASMRAPLAAIIMVSEMTGGYGLVVPLMLVCVSSYVLGRRWGVNREQVRSSAESPAHAGDAVVHMLETWRVKDVMQKDWQETVPPNATLADMIQRVELGTRPVFAVVKNGRIQGLISVPDIERVMRDTGGSDAIIAADMMTEDLEVVTPNQDVYSAMTDMARANHIVMPVVDNEESRRFLGMLSRQDVYTAVREQLEEMRKHLLLEHEGLMAFDREEGLHQLVMGVATPKRENIQRLLVPMQAVGRSLREADFRRQFGIQVVAIEQPDGTLQCPPDPDAPLETSQRLVAIMLDEAKA